MIGRWSSEVKPHADRFTMGGKLGVEVVLKPDAAAAVGELIVRLATVLDATEDQVKEAVHLAAVERLKHQATLRLVRDVLLFVGWAAALVVGAWALS